VKTLPFVFVTVRVALPAPSLTDRLDTEKLTTSSSTIVAVICAEPNTAPALTPLSVTVNDSLPSNVLSFVIGTEIVREVVSPSFHVSVPERAVKSAPDVAVPLAVA
jgi:hypothetical protein